MAGGPTEDDSLIATWRDAIEEPAIVDLIDQLHAEAHRHIDAQAPVCVASGRCCRFEQFGHRLFVTGLETALTLSRIERTVTTEDVNGARTDGNCPFQLERLCSIHESRPLACRLFFCDAGADAWMPHLSQDLHNRLRSLHDLWSIPYRYGEWRDMLAMFAADPR